MATAAAAAVVVEEEEDGNVSMISRRSKAQGSNLDAQDNGMYDWWDCSTRHWGVLGISGLPSFLDPGLCSAITICMIIETSESGLSRWEIILLS